MCVVIFLCEEMWIYALRLRHGKYYIGRTIKDPHERMKEHLEGGSRATQWTIAHPPEAVDAQWETKDPFDEDKYTKVYMADHGIANVRGGTYCQINFPAEVFQLLENELVHASGRCYRCQRHGHLAKNCPRRATLVDPSLLVPPRAVVNWPILIISLALFVLAIPFVIRAGSLL
jgi:hypothetical protein